MPAGNNVGPYFGSAQTVGGSTLPATPTPRQLFMKTSGGSEGLYICLSSGVWVLLDTSAHVGTVTSVSVVSANGFSGSVATATTTPAITINNPTALVATTSITDNGLTAGRVTYAGTSGLLSDDSGFTYNSGTHALTATTFVGALTGIASGNTLVSVVPNTLPSAGQILAGNAGGTAYAPVSMSSDATLASTGALTLASTIVAGGPTGSATVAPIITYDAKGRLTAVSSATITPAVGSITGLGTGVGTALALNIGSAGAPVLFNGAGGTPSSLTGTNITGTASGLTAGTASAVAVGGVTGLGTSVATALAVNVGTAGAFVVNGGALGTPSSGTATNLSGTAASLTAGTATNATNAATVTHSDNASYFLTFVASNSSANQPVNVGPATYNPSTSTITATTFVGAVTGHASSDVPTTTTVNGKALSGNITLGLASSDFANQGTTATVLHGNAAGNPSFGAVSLTADVSGVLPTANIAVALANQTSINGLGITASTGTLTITNAKTLTILKTMSLTAADDTGVYTLPTGTKTLLATDGAGTSLTGIPYTLTGTANQVVLSAGTGNITFSLPQSIATASTPQFAKLGLGRAADASTGVIYIGTTASGTQYGADIEVTGAATSNVGVYAAASGATNNTALVVAGPSAGTGQISISQTGTAVNNFAGPIVNTGITSDGGHTDAAVCADTTSKQFYTGSGAAGICLGTSSIRFKRSLSDIKEGLAEVLKLRPRNFRYKKGIVDSGERLQYGLVAEEVNSIIPNIVAKGAKNEINSIDYGTLFPILIKAIQELYERCDAQAELLSTRLNTLMA